MLGVELEDQQALDRVAETSPFPASRSPSMACRTLGQSYGCLEGRAGPPLPLEVVAADDLVMELTKERGLFPPRHCLAGESRSYRLTGA